MYHPSQKLRQRLSVGRVPKLHSEWNCLNHVRNKMKNKSLPSRSKAMVIQGYNCQNSKKLTIFAIRQCESKLSIFKVTRFGCLRARRPLRWWSSVLLIFSMTLESEAWNHRIVGVKVSRVFEKIYSTTVFLQFFTLNFF